MMVKRMSDQERQRHKREHWSWIRMILEQSAYGFLVGVLVALLLMQFDVNRIGTMIAHSDQRIGFTVLMMFGFGMTFGMVAGGAAIWFRAIAENDE